MPGDTNHLGSIFGGKVMQYIDTTAAVAAMRHARRVCVTASIDRLDFHVPIAAGHIVILQASVNRAFGTSMEVGVRVEREDPLTGERARTASAYLTFVALDERRRPVAVPPVQPESEAEQRRYREAGARRARRLAPADPDPGDDPCPTA
ncbi:MAG: acyl-CoA thioesterase [Nitrospirae bacterium]|nr:MAG: acyl-CoA thioesterase [Nitrospirota bacterium]